jgi:ribosomal protein S27AE
MNRREFKTSIENCPSCGKPSVMINFWKDRNTQKFRKFCTHCGLTVKLPEEAQQSKVKYPTIYQEWEQAIKSLKNSNL